MPITTSSTPLRTACTCVCAGDKSISESQGINTPCNHVQQRTSLVDHGFQAGNEGVGAFESKALFVAEFFLVKIFQLIAFRQLLHDTQHLVLGTLGLRCLDFGPGETGLDGNSFTICCSLEAGRKPRDFQQRTVNEHHLGTSSSCELQHFRRGRVGK